MNETPSADPLIEGNNYWVIGVLYPEREPREHLAYYRHNDIVGDLWCKVSTGFGIENVTEWKALT